MPGVKAQPPEYPRPVSPVSTDDYPICIDNTVYVGEVNGFEDSVKQRVAKRRRIESCATAYLRGEPLFILSAQLKGPFGSGWKNPWKKGRGPDGNNRESQFEVPETACKPGFYAAASSISNSRRAPLEDNLPPRAALTTVQTKNPAQKSNIDLPPAVSHPSTIPAADIGPSNQKVKEWLKTNDNYSDSEDEQSHSSPTPSFKPTNARTRKWESPVVDLPILVEPDSVVNLTHLLPPPLPKTSAQRRPPQCSKRRTTTPNAIKVSEATVSTIHQPGLAADSTREDDQTVDHTTKEASAYKSGAEYAILDSKRRSLHTVPPSSHLPAFEYRRVSTEKAAEAVPATADANATIEPTARELSGRLNDLPQDSIEIFHSLDSAEAAIPKTEVAIPSLSKEPSRSSTIHDLPSAQIPAQSALPATLSDFSSNVHMLEELDKPDVQEPPDDPLSRNIKPSAPNVLEMNSTSEQVEVEVPFPDQQILPNPVVEALRSIRSSSTPKSGVARPSDTQDMIESITPFAFTTVKKSTTSETKVTPKTATKSRTFHPRKRTSFAPEEVSSCSSQGSLKAIMKVAKPTTINQGRIDGVKGAWTREDSDENSIHHIPSNVSNEPEKKTACKGILKSSLTNSGAVPVSSALHASSSAKQDAQKVRMLDMVDNEPDLDEDDFDVDAAIDDLGSFLGTWDADKEALQLGKASGH